LDDFEGVHVDLYSCHEINVKTNAGSILTARAYLLDNYKKSLLSADTILFDNYSSVNKYFRPYINKKDFPNYDFNDYLKQIKEKL